MIICLAIMIKLSRPAALTRHGHIIVVIERLARVLMLRGPRICSIMIDIMAADRASHGRRRHGIVGQDA